ncbi:unnamed protein product [Auanema sp. JU1783]|nr:unnamed protein product [Auanema sp. JU1783]
MSITHHIREPFNQKLYQFYCWLCEQSTELTAHQATFLIEEIQRLAGYPSTSKHFAFNGEDVSYRELLSLLENLFADDTKELECTIDALFDRYLNQVINKGFIRFRCKSAGKIGCFTRLNRWSNVWISVEPGLVVLQKLKRNSMGQKIEITLDRSYTLKNLYQEDSMFITGVEGNSKTFEFAHYDLNSCRLLEKALQLSLTVLTAEELTRVDKRTASHYHGQEVELEAEKRERLEKEKLKLERALEEERQALKDEEIVRGLATRMLEEERLKSEQMERVLEELQQRLYTRNLTDEDEAPTDDDQPEPYEVDPINDQTFREYANELEHMHQESLLPNGEDIWSKQDLLIISTQSI